ncbi:oocyte zinc finger -like [Pelobates cultripes]|uniref:Oocyte zinc finger -like n=1 Tax=Pelobates cultripes TaxID=61616 RepID=A0AAD1TDM4_PELCU|nr:oocyte zinc finger -like [Pelobates cultripes]
MRFQSISIMKKYRNQMTERILNLTLEIIYLLTGQDYVIVKKPYERVPHSISKEGFSRTHSPNTVLPPHSLIHEKKILELTNQIIQLLTGEVPIRCEDVTVYFSMEEWEYLEGHQDLYKDVMMENHHTLSLLDISMDRVKTNGLCSLTSPDCFTESKQNNQRHVEPTLFKPSPATQKTVINATNKEVSYEKGNITDVYKPRGHTQREHSSTVINKESTANECRNSSAMDIYTHTPTECPSTHVKVDSGSAKGRNVADTDIYTPTAHTQMECASTLIKKESASHESSMCSDGKITHTDHYASREHTEIEYTPINKDSTTHEEINLTDIFLTAEHTSIPFVEQSNTMSQKLNVNKDSQVRTYNEFNKTSTTTTQNSSALERIYTNSGYKTFFSIHSDRVKQQGITKDQKTSAVKEPFLCKACGRCFDEEGLLKLHWITHLGERTFTCSECGEHFPLHAELIKHMKTHRGRKMYPCSDCGKSFNRESHLNLHLRTHTGEKPYSCTECGKSFSQKSHLGRHQSVHTGVKQYACFECGIHFIRKSDLVLHQRSHSRVEAFICSDCGKCFTHHSSLLLHQKSHTSENVLF